MRNRGIGALLAFMVSSSFLHIDGDHANHLPTIPGALMNVFCRLTLITAGMITTISAAITVDDKIPAYQPVAALSGDLNSVGSDTLNNLMTYWAEGFAGIYPNVEPQIEGKGSSTAPPALTGGTAQLGPMSREMKPSEMDDFERKWGYKPTCIKVAVDALAVFVHKDNPIKSLTLTQVDGIFSSTYKRGGKDAKVWGDLGLSGDWAGKPFSLYGRNAASGTYGFFKEHTLAKGDFKSTVKEQPGSSAVVQGIANDLGGIGYSGIGYATAGVRALPLADKGAAVDPTYENALSGKYPLARFLYVYINKKPGQAADPLVGEFIKFVVSKEGQEIVVKDGYFPLPAAVVAETLAMLAK
jgi:phosphate transport system substrate-binding protein